MSNEALKIMRERAVAEGTRLATKLFEKRGNRSEVHLDRGTLAALLAVAYEQGYEARDAQGEDTR